MFHDGFISQLVGRPVVLKELPDQPIGKVADFYVEKPDDTFPRIDAIVIDTRDGRRSAPIASVAEIDRDGKVVLEKVPTAPALPNESAFYIIRDLFDKQIVDVNGRRIVRINDIEVANTTSGPRIVAADVGVSGLMRRLGFGRFAKPLVEHAPRALIAWDHVAPIREINPSEVRLSVSGRRLERLHPSELAEIISSLSTHEAASVVKSLDVETAADAMEHLEPEVQRSLIEDLGKERAADIIEEMESDDAADLLGDLPSEQQSELLAEMEPETAGGLRDLVKFDERTAGGMMTTDFFWILAHRTAQATIDKMRELAPYTDFIYYLYVTDKEQKLLGVVSLRALLLAEPEQTIYKIMETDLVTVTTDVSAENVAAAIARYDLLAVPVVDEHERIIGIVTVDDAIDAILPPRLAQRFPRMLRHHPPRQEVS